MRVAVKDLIVVVVGSALGVMPLAVGAAAPAGTDAHRATDPGGPTNRGRTVVLDTSGFWRMHQVLRTPVMQADGALIPIPRYDGKAKLSWQERQLSMWHDLLGAGASAPAPDGWLKPDFDDSTWVRGTAARACRTPYLDRLYLRGKFTITERDRVQGLKLSLGYHGGAAAYVNGREIARQHLPKGSEVAEAYPDEVFVDKDGKLLSLRELEYLLSRDSLPQETVRRIEQRVRTLEVAIPDTLLRQGMNVVAVEIARAPYHKVFEEQKATSKNHGKHEVYELSWNTCQIKRVQLTAGSPDGLVPNATRPQGVQVWNSDLMATDYDMDFGDRAEPLRPIRLVGARNGTYSGKVVVGSHEPITGLTANAGDLTGEGGTIPASQVRIRYALPWGAVALVNRNNYEMIPYPAEVDPLFALAEEPPQEFPVREKNTAWREIPQSDVWRIRRWGLVGQFPLKTPGQPSPVFGAVAPVWVTVTVPKDSRPDTYSGTVAIEAGGKKLANVAVELKVEDWTLPDASDFRTWVELIQSPYTLAAEYDVPLWSDRHWELVARSLGFVREVGSTVLFCPLIAQSNAGNEESMVRWVKKGEDTFEYDFSAMEKYLDLAEEHLGKPEVVVFNVWDRYLTRKESGGRGFQVQKGLTVAKNGPLVTVTDRASGKTENVALPAYTDPASQVLWRPLFDQLRARMRKRGLEQAMHLGMVSDFWATREQTAFLKEVSGDLPWANTGHYVRKSLYNGLASFGYQSSYFGTRFGHGKSLHGWQRPDLVALFERVGLDYYPLVKWRKIAEQSVTGNVRGIGRLGADTWLAIRDKTGRRKYRVWQRYPGSDWGYLNCNSAVLAPGPDGPIATAQFEALREGVQECEALILIEQALTDDEQKLKLGADLVRRCEQALDERRLVMWKSFSSWQSGAHYAHEPTSWRGVTGPTGYTWFLGTDWQGRSEKLYRLAGEVAAALRRRQAEAIPSDGEKPRG